MDSIAVLLSLQAAPPLDSHLHSVKYFPNLKSTFAVLFWYDNSRNYYTPTQFSGNSICALFMVEKFVLFHKISPVVFFMVSLHEKNTESQIAEHT